MNLLPIKVLRMCLTQGGRVDGGIASEADSGA